MLYPVQCWHAKDVENSNLNFIDDNITQLLLEPVVRVEELLLVQRGGGEQIVLGRRGALLLVKLEVGAEERLQRRQLHVGEVGNATRVRARVGARLLLRGRTRARKAALEAAARMLRRAANFVKALL